MSKVKSDQIEVEFDGRKCIHARKCVLGLPEVFNPDAGRKWIMPENADAKDIAQVVDACPSGALTYVRTDGVEEKMPEINTARLWENGPIECSGDIRIAGEEPRKRVVLCRCGKSKSKPYCDNSHLDGAFVATGDLPTTEKVGALAQRDGKLEIKAIKNGPLMVVGNLEVIAGSGRRVATGERHVMCRCGASKNKPFCDGSHKEIGFEAD